ncbi:MULTISPECIES: hypothetical protein [unclassified Aeromicrobium]|uniref:hypothetical protein n=1 Tax=unclassified Aeromicrobium TaxID=2633570 RepID=UPI00288B1BE7|nr:MULTISPECIES: hypothetical protein [unclassified Aeromicrobium]
MAVSTRLRGNTGLVLKLKVGAAAAIEFGGDVKSARLTTEDKDDSDLTFEEAASGDVKDFILALTAIQSTDAGSLWRFLWDNPGAEIVVVYGPHGNTAASVSKPHFTFTVKADGKPEVGGEARRTTEGQEFEYELKATTAVTLVTA